MDRVLDTVEACLWLGLVVLGSAVAYTVLQGDAAHRSPPPQAAVRPSLEAEDMPVVAKSRNFTFWLQPTSGFTGGRWSRDGQMLALDTRQGDWIDLGLPARAPGRYRLELLLTRAADYGIVALSLDGTRIGEPVDLWSGRGVVPAEPVDLGTVELRGEGDVLRIEVVGANPAAAAPFYQFGIDGVRLRRE